MAEEKVWGKMKNKTFKLHMMDRALMCWANDCKCSACGIRVSPNRHDKKIYKELFGYSPEVMHVDHIIPRSNGGTHDKTNLQILCPSCNISKSNHEVTEMPFRITDESIKKERINFYANIGL